MFKKKVNKGEKEEENEVYSRTPVLSSRSSRHAQQHQRRSTGNHPAKIHRQSPDLLCSRMRGVLITEYKGVHDWMVPIVRGRLRETEAHNETELHAPVAVKLAVYIINDLML